MSSSTAAASLSLASISFIFCLHTSIPWHMQVASRALARMEK